MIDYDNPDGSELFDRHERPDLADYADAEEAWAACTDYDSYVHDIGESLSEDEWDRMISDVNALYAEYYARFES